MSSAPTNSSTHPHKDAVTQVDELKKMVQDFCEARDWDQFHNPKELAIGISTEAAELLEHFRFQSTEQMQEKMRNTATREAVSHELADTLFFILRFAQMEAIDLSTILEEKIELSAKKYPVELAKGKNAKYTEFQS